MNPTEPNQQLSGSTSNDNVYLNYVCLINDGHQNPEDGSPGRKSLHLVNNSEGHMFEAEESYQIERSTALHELLQGHKPVESEAEAQNHNNTTISCTNTATANPEPPTTSEISQSELEIVDQRCFDNPHVLKLTKMKWLSEGQSGSPDSSPSISPVMSSTSSTFSRESDDGSTEHPSISEKYILSSVLRLDKEHNLFGLSNMTTPLVGSRISTSKKMRKEDEKPVFHQTAIVQICSSCPSKTCKFQSKTGLPSSLRCCGTCGSCRSCSVSCYDASCVSCSNSCVPPRPPSNIFKPVCWECPKVCKNVVPKRCIDGCTTCFGLKIKLNRKPKFDPPLCELTPKSSCVMGKPLAARTCTHCPKCMPPTPGFPYLMPCYWPSRASAPCATPARCFHNPPCMPARKRKRPVDPGLVCPKSCIGSKMKVCPNIFCPGMNEEFKKNYEMKFVKRKPSNTNLQTKPEQPPANSGQPPARSPSK